MANGDTQANAQDQKALFANAQHEKLKLEIEKLRIELENLKKGKKLSPLIPYLPLITVLVTIAGFAFGIYQYRAQQQANREAQAEQSSKDREARDLQFKRDTQAAQQEFMRPLLQNQLSLYLQASEAVATISTSTDPVKRKKATDDFWRLYEGPLLIVQSVEVARAMRAFGDCLNEPGACEKGEMSVRVQAIASRMQESLLRSWNTNPENFAADKFTYR